MQLCGYELSTHESHFLLDLLLSVFVASFPAIHFGSCYQTEI
uniref:Uncharacterized protein n=1 Tax=Rhizophora mucronata TaxID=61149 RepID=A0A2P2NY78_RHIMU